MPVQVAAKRKWAPLASGTTNEPETAVMRCSFEVTAYPDQLELWTVCLWSGRISRGLEGIRTPARPTPALACTPPGAASSVPAADAAQATSTHSARLAGTLLIERSPVYESQAGRTNRSP